MENNFLDYRNAVAFNPEKFYKTTLFQSERMMLGLNCLEPGQVQEVHEHADQDKFYFVLEGEGLFVVGDMEKAASAGMVVLAPATIIHGVRNIGHERLVILMGIAPGPTTSK
ncbi:MAG: cupin domain-containing protein [Chloroflexi bacterium HGW-Chloroflexi-3]|nr:MAG: cupin domain-containing protein [Chloroflexi bacterium HGW-Chloroflexi-3]